MVGVLVLAPVCGRGGTDAAAGRQDAAAQSGACPKEAATEPTPEPAWKHDGVRVVRANQLDGNTA